MIIDNRKRAGIGVVLTVSSFVFIQICFRFLPGVFAPLNHQATDRLFMLRSAVAGLKPRYDDTIVHVDINNTSLHKLNTYYLNRSHFARVIRNLAAMRVSRQMYDFIFAAPIIDRDDQAIVSATRDAGDVYFGVTFLLSRDGQASGGDYPLSPETLKYLSETKWKIKVEGDASTLYAGVKPLPTFYELASVSRGLGFLSLKTDEDGYYRRVPLLVRYGDAFYPSLPFRVACDHLGVTPDRIVVTPGRSVTLKGVGGAGRAPHDVSIPIDRLGNMVVNFIGPWERMKHYNFADIYRASDDQDVMEMWTEELAGRIVLVSDVSTGSTDIGPVPTDINFPLSGLHANVLHTILTEEFFRQMPDGGMVLIELLLALLLVLLAVSSSFAVFAWGATLVFLGFTSATVFSFFGLHLILLPVRPLMAVGLSVLTVMIYRYFQEEKEKEVLRKTVEAYFAPPVVKKIMANPGIIGAKGQKKELTVMFTDIEGFTSCSTNLPPDRLQRLLNDYFEAMVDIVFSYEGTVDKYIGDGLMVFFGDPEYQADHAWRCVSVAVSMQKAAKKLSDRWERETGMPLRIRIGVNTGEMVVGNMGSARRLSYTVVGAPVNIAQRLESAAPAGGVFIGQRTLELLDGAFPVKSLGPIQFKGIDDGVDAYEVISDEENPGLTTGCAEAK